MGVRLVSGNEGWAERRVGGAYSSILGGFGSPLLKCDPVTLVLEALRGDESLDSGGLGVGLLALALRLDLAANDEFADLRFGLLAGDVFLAGNSMANIKNG